MKRKTFLSRLRKFFNGASEVVVVAGSQRYDLIILSRAKGATINYSENSDDYTLTGLVDLFSNGSPEYYAAYDELVYFNSAVPTRMVNGTYLAQAGLYIVQDVLTKDGINSLKIVQGSFTNLPRYKRDYSLFEDITTAVENAHVSYARVITQGVITQ